MRVLLANKFLVPRGGAEQSLFLMEKVLRNAGHHTIRLGMAAPSLEASAECVLLPAVRHDRPAWHPASWRAGRRALGFGVRRFVRRAIAEARPDVAVLGNVYHQLGAPALLDELADQHVPAVAFLHDFRVVCPAHLLFRDDMPCEACAGGAVGNAVRHACGGSRARGLLLAASWLRERSRWRHVRAFVAPSRFLIEKVRELGFEHPVRLLRNAVELAPPRPTVVSKPVFGFAGRLAPEKGLDVLLAAAARAPDLEFRIAGDGPLAPCLRGARPSNVRVLGSLDRAELATERRVWRAEVVPSVAYENCPNSVLEALSASLPVVASNQGGLPELVDGHGLLFRTGDAADLTRCVRRLADEPQAAAALGRSGRAFVARECAPAVFRRRLLALLAEVTA